MIENKKINAKEFFSLDLSLELIIYHLACVYVLQIFTRASEREKEFNPASV